MKTYKSVAKAARLWPQPQFDSELAIFIRKRYGQLVDRCRRIIAGRIEPVEVGAAIRGFIPALCEQHSLAQSEYFGFQFLEPQASAGIAHFCQETAQITIRDARCRALVRALLPNIGAHQALLDSLDTAGRFAAVAEDPLPSNTGRMDLVISWTNASNQPCCVVVEMKCGHVVTRGQLEDYGRQGLHYVGQKSANLSLVLLTPDGRSKKVDRRRLKLDWQPVSWLSFLRAWDLELAKIGETSRAFALFRRQLWRLSGV